MEKQLLDLIEKLSTQLGQTTEATWGILLAQAKIAAITNFIVGGILLVFTLILIFIGIKCSKEGEGEASVWSIVFSVLFALISFAFTLPAINATCNPEFWALQKLIEMI